MIALNLCKIHNKHKSLKDGDWDLRVLSCVVFKFVLYKMSYEWCILYNCIKFLRSLILVILNNIIWRIHQTFLCFIFTQLYLNIQQTSFQRILTMSYKYLAHNHVHETRNFNRTRYCTQICKLQESLQEGLKFNKFLNFCSLQQII